MPVPVVSKVWSAVGQMGRGTVTATVSDELKVDLAKKLGADEIIMYRSEGVPEYVARLPANKGFDVIFDTVGGENLDRSFEAAREGGQHCHEVNAQFGAHASKSAFPSRCVYAFDHDTQQGETQTR